ncbi:MAG: ABC transporter permease subunit [Coprobacillus sp.]
MKHKIRLGIIIILIWQLTALWVGKSVILPYPIEVFSQMISMLGQMSFYQTLFITISHVVIVVFISAVLAFLLAYIGYQKPLIDEYVSPLLSMLQAVPNIAYIMLLLLWTSSLYTVYIVLFLVVFPLLYNNFIQGFKSIDHDLRDVILLYHPSFFDKLIHVYLPLIQPSFLSGMKSSLNLGVKVVVMAEILSGLSYGVGREINFAKGTFDMVSLFAWTIWLIIMILFIDYILKRFIRSAE